MFIMKLLLLSYMFISLYLFIVLDSDSRWCFKGKIRSRNFGISRFYSVTESVQSKTCENKNKVIVSFFFLCK